MVQLIVLDPALTQLVSPDAQVQQIATGFQFTEGPVWHSRQQHLLFSDIPGDTLYRWTAAAGHQVFRRPSGQANGNTYDRQGRLVTCEHANRRVSRSLPDGTIDVLAEGYQGKRFNSPNDVICAANGDLYFTDPPYGLRQPDGSFAGQELDICGVYRLSAADGAVTLLVDDCARPNGLTLNAAETQIFIDDTERHHIRVFERDSAGMLRQGRIFAELIWRHLIGRPDGMKMDREGHLYVAGGTPEGVWVFNPQGRLYGLIGVGEEPANLAWGGGDWRTLFVTARTSVYCVPMRVAGIPVVV